MREKPPLFGVFTVLKISGAKFPTGARIFRWLEFSRFFTLARMKTLPASALLLALVLAAPAFAAAAGPGDIVPFAAAAAAKPAKPEKKSAKKRPERRKDADSEAAAAKLQATEKKLAEAEKELAHLRDSLHTAQKELAAKADRIAELEASQKTAPQAKTAATAAPDKPKPKPASKPASKPPVEAKLTVIESVRYDLKSAVNYQDRARALGQIRAFLRQSPKARVELIGHADDTPYPEANREISENRAQYLAAWLTANGLPESQMGHRGVGQSRPAKGEAHDRRVEIIIRE